MHIRHCIVKIGSASDGSLQARVAVEEPATGRGADQPCNSGETRKIPVRSDGRIHAVFAPYPCPPGNIPHDLPPSDECLLFIQRVSGSASLQIVCSDGQELMIDDAGPHLVSARTGMTFIVTMI